MVTPLRLHFTGRDSGKQCSSWRTSNAYKVARVCEEGGGGERGEREGLNGTHSALCVTSEFHEYVYGETRETSGLSRFAFRDSPREMRRRLFRKVPRCCPPPYQDKLILMPDTVVDVCTQAWISATDDYLSRDNGTMCARLVCCTMRKMYGFVARRGFVSSDFNEIGELLIAAALGWQLAIDNL